jgi:archaellum biogenesis ATPase FlaH
MRSSRSSRVTLQQRTTEHPTPPLMAFDFDEAERFLSLLGKNGSSRLRAFWPKKTPVPEGTPRAFKASFTDAPTVLPRWQDKGLGIYVVIGNGGDDDNQITDCPALFIEWDDRPKADQIIGWQTHNLPEPTFMVDTGGKSIHLYWVLTEPIDTDRWCDLIARLIAHTGADTTNRNPSRVMRLPGAWHFTWDPDAQQICPNGQSAIIAASGHRYDAAIFDELLPRIDQPAPQDTPRLELFSSPSDELPPRPTEMLYDAMSRVPEFHHGEGRYAELLGLAKRLHVEIGRDAALQLLRSHSPHVSDMDAYFIKAPDRISPGSLWPFLREHYGLDISRGDLGGRRQQSPRAGSQAAQNGSTSQETDHSASPSPDALPRRSELLTAALDAAESNDDDTYAELMAELMGRFRMTGSHVQAQLFRLLTARRADGTSPKAGTVNIANADHLEHRLPGFIPAAEQALLFAPRGAGKTIAALAISRSIVTGTPLLDQGTPPAKGRVLYLATDSGCASMRTQMQELGLLDLPQFQHGHPDESFFIRGYDATQGISAWESTIPEVLWLIRFVKDNNIDLVIIDSAKACLSLTDTDYTDNRAVGALLTLFQRVVCPHCAVLWLNHDGRENGHNAGAKAWSEIPVMVHRIERIEQQRPGPRTSGEDDERIPKNARKWICVKSRISLDERDFLYSLNADGDLVLSDLVEVVTNCRDAILQVLTEAAEQGDSSMHRSDIFSTVMRRHGRSSKSVENTLAQMSRGRSPDLVRPARGHYGLSPRLQEQISLKGWGTIGGGNSQIPSSATDLGSPQGSPIGGNSNPQQAPSGEVWGEPKSLTAQGESPSPPPTHTSTPQAAAGDPMPDWIPQLARLRRERPADAASTLALALDPDGTGRPTGAEVKRWLPTADGLNAEGYE